MSLVIIDEGKRVRIPRTVRSSGPEGIEEFLQAQRAVNAKLGKKPAPRSKQRQEED